MAKLTITEAIKQSGISRTHFYGKYIKKGLISVSEDLGKKYIDSSELVRVFPATKIVNKIEDTEQTSVNTIEHHKITLAVQAEKIRNLEEKLLEAKDREIAQLERERFYRDQIRMLDTPQKDKKTNPISKWWNNLK